MAYTPPARNAVNLVIGDGYTPPARNAVNLQFGDDPLMREPIQVTGVGLNNITVALSPTWPSTFNPQATVRRAQRSTNGTDWTTVGTFIGGIYNDSPLSEGNCFWYRSIVETTLVPTPRQAVSPSTSAWTDFMLEVTDVRDSANNILTGALIVALPAGQLLALIAATANGQDWPILAFRRCNRTNNLGRCSIRVPGGNGPAVTLMIPTAVNIGGDILVPVNIIG